MKQHFKWTAAALLAVFTGAVVMTLVIALHFGRPGLALGCLAVLPMLGMLSFYTDLPTYSFAENVTDALVGKEGYPVEIVPGTLNIQLNNTGIPIGVMFERLEGSQAVKVHLRGCIRKAVSAAALNAPCYVAWSANGLVAGTSGAKCAGIAIYPYNPAVGDIVSFIMTDCIMP
jgi:hypothetical protein